MGDAPRIIIIAGPNGAGKTTFAREYLPHEAGCPFFINADLIAEGLSPFDPERAAVRAGRLMIEEIDRHAKAKTSFAFETTLSGRMWSRKIPDWRAEGYLVDLVFLSLPNAETAIMRVAMRVRQGGHNVPEATIRRRFASGLRNFYEIYRPLVDAWAIYDNSESPPRLITKRGRDGK